MVGAARFRGSARGSGRVAYRWLTLGMPWCPACARYLTPTSMETDGTCPFCKQIVDYRRNAKFEQATARGEELEADVPLPWHLKLLLIAAAIYLGWRAWQGIDWLIGRF